MLQSHVLMDSRTARWLQAQYHHSLGVNNSPSTAMHSPHMQCAAQRPDIHVDQCEKQWATTTAKHDIRPQPNVLSSLVTAV
jgi:hypothetical protein